MTASRATGGQERIIAGVDGCHSGWLAVIERNAGLDALIAPNLEALLIKIPGALIGIDIPIGLPDRGSRNCDLRARTLLGRPRGSSVFPAPIRACLSGGSHETLSLLHRSLDGRGLTKQAFHLLPKIKDVDDFLGCFPGSALSVREVHPEVSFAMWNGKKPMLYNKSRLEGRLERERLINSEWPGERDRLSRQLKGNQFAADDLNDAFAALWSARRIAADQAKVLPDEVQQDSKGLPMRIEA